MDADYYILEKCRLCNSTSLEVVLSLQPSPICDEYLVKPREQPSYPLNLLLCKGCGFVQIDCVINPNVIYKDYIFVTTSSLPLRSHFNDYAADIVERANLDSAMLAIDIGSNEGTLLKGFKSAGLRVLGIEPSSQIAALANRNGIDTICDYFNPSLARSIVSANGQADVVTINNVFANIDDLREFMNGLSVLVKESGYVIIESSYLVDMLDNMILDFIYHEHLSYLSIKPLEKLFVEYGFNLVDVVHVDTKGGSLRYYFQKIADSNHLNVHIEQWRRYEEQKCIYSVKAYQAYEASIQVEKDKSHQELSKYAEGSVVGYGASATTTTLLYHFQLGQKISYLVDDNPAKVGTFSPGYHLPVYGPERLYQEPPDAIFIFAWRYAATIIENHPEFTGRFIIPLPSLTVL